MNLTNLVQPLLNLIWPPVCALCPARLPLMEPGPPASRLCPDCLSSVEFMPQSRCPRCALPFFEADRHICPDCLAVPPVFETARAALVYKGGVARSISLLKYHSQLNQLPLLTALAAPALSVDVADYDLILPLPLSKAKLRRRGFNQSWELAHRLYRPWRHLLDDKVLRRIKEGPTQQAGLSTAERRRAIKGCFIATRDLTGARILLFDDVLTTGATTNEAAAVLYRAKARKVDLAVLARTPHPSQKGK